ncbi:MAG: glycosyltransferase, partial [Mycobacterium sp.]|nr:glycosyltransferase [Mycobacterium sp.]
MADGIAARPFGSLLDPRFSARNALGPSTLAALAALVAVVVLLSLLYPDRFPPAVAMVSAWIYLVSAIDRNMLLLRGVRSSVMVWISESEARAVPDHELPSYTVLLPVYQEPSIVQNLINGVGNLDYPPDKIDVMLLVEEDDAATQQAVAGLSLNGIRVVLVPHSLPKTKPKACNYAMSLPEVDSELITLYDAEDVPEPLQLRRAAVAFSRAPADIGCLQARLAYFNERQNLLTRWFSMEYDQWFGAVLPALQQAGCVVPLGGTSSHLPVRAWREARGRGEHNVTRDADPGGGLGGYGYRP